MSKPAWPERIRELTSKLKLSQAGLAALLGVSPATVSRWLRGSHEPTSAAYLAMGNLIGSPDANYFWERAGLESANFPGTDLRDTLSSLRVNLKDFNLVNASKASADILQKKPGAVLLPLLNVIAYGDRVPPGTEHVSLAQARVLDVLMAPVSWCPHPENMLCMRVFGDSMAPVIYPDAILCIDTAVTDRGRLDKKLAVFSHRDEGFKVARFQRLSSSDILVSANHNCSPVDVSDQAKWKAIGEVVWWLSKDAPPPQNGKAANGAGRNRKS